MLCDHFETRTNPKLYFCSGTFSIWIILWFYCNFPFWLFKSFSFFVEFIWVGRDYWEVWVLKLKSFHTDLKAVQSVWVWSNFMWEFNVWYFPVGNSDACYCLSPSLFCCDGLWYIGMYLQAKVRIKWFGPGFICCNKMFCSSFILPHHSEFSLNQFNYILGMILTIQVICFKINFTLHNYFHLYF